MSYIFEKYVFFSAKKILLFLNIGNMLFNQSSLVKPNPKKKNLEKSQKNIFFFSQKSENFEYIYFLPLKMQFSKFFQLRRLVFDQSSPGHPNSESSGGSLSVTKKDGRTNARTEILVSKIGFKKLKESS